MVMLVQLGKVEIEMRNNMTILDFNSFGEMMGS